MCGYYDINQYGYTPLIELLAPFTRVTLAALSICVYSAGGFHLYRFWQRRTNKDLNERKSLLQHLVYCKTAKYDDVLVYCHGINTIVSQNS